MTGIEDMLRDLGSTDPAPTADQLGGVDAVVAAVPDLEVALLPRLVDTVASWVEAPPNPALVSAVLERLPDVQSPVSAATCVDRLLVLTVAGKDDDIARALMTKLLALVEEGFETEALALRAGYAVRAAVDLALLQVGVSTHAVLATLENLPDIPPEMAPGVARAAGRLWEHHREPFLQRVLEERVLPHEDAAGDALLELGLEQLRTAFEARDMETAVEAMDRAQELLDRSRTQDEDRPDARAFAAACRAVAGFRADEAAMSAALAELAEARAELERYTLNDAAGFRGAAPLRSIADWQILAATLRGLRAHLDRPDLLKLRPAIEALTDAYTGMRLGVLQDERRGFIGFIRPLLRNRLATSPALSDAVAQFAGEEPASAGARQLVSEVVRPKAATRSRTTRAKPRRRNQR